MKEQESKKTFEAFQSLKSLQKTPTGFDFEKAKWLAYFKKDERYREIMGDPEASWRSFVNSKELQPLKISTADRLVKIYTTYIQDLEMKENEIAGIDSLHLYRLASVVNKQNVEMWLAKARRMSRDNLYRELKYGHVDENSCQHKWNCKETCVCKICGAKEIKKGRQE